MSTEDGSSAKTMLKQATLYLDEKKRTNIARSVELASMHNILANLKYYGRRKNEEIMDYVNVINEVTDKMKRAKDINALMLLEAKARRSYYSAFNHIIGRTEFRFVARTRKPPMDPLNALISFGNVFLYNCIATEIAKTSLDMRIGFLHTTGDRHFSLNLDIAEIFKPLIVDRSIFTVINRRMINAGDHFRILEDGGVYLNTYGKQIFIRELETKLNRVQSDREKSMTYLSRIKEEIGKINRMVTKDETYKPYRYIG